MLDTKEFDYRSLGLLLGYPWRAMNLLSLAPRHYEEFRPRHVLTKDTIELRRAQGLDV
jgi:hypothetical protein